MSIIFYPFAGEQRHQKLRSALAAASQIPKDSVLFPCAAPNLVKIQEFTPNVLSIMLGHLAAEQRHQQFNTTSSAALLALSFVCTAP